VTDDPRTEPPPDDRLRRRDRDASRRRRRRAAVRGVAAAALLVGVFLAGLTIGKAVEDTPQPGGTQTLVRTLQPVTVAPEARTVTVTVGSP
jgi:hypothetical protein